MDLSLIVLAVLCVASLTMTIVPTGRRYVKARGALGVALVALAIYIGGQAPTAKETYGPMHAAGNVAVFTILACLAVLFGWVIYSAFRSTTAPRQ
jgi:hypothetical protein